MNRFYKNKILLVICIVTLSSCTSKLGSETNISSSSSLSNTTNMVNTISLSNFSNFKNAIKASNFSNSAGFNKIKFTNWEDKIDNQGPGLNFCPKNKNNFMQSKLNMTFPKTIAVNTMTTTGTTTPFTIPLVNTTNITSPITTISTAKDIVINRQEDVAGNQGKDHFFVFKTAQDAIAGIHPIKTYELGKYDVYKELKTDGGVGVNISNVEGSPGVWINKGSIQYGNEIKNPDFLGADNFILQIEDSTQVYGNNVGFLREFFGLIDVIGEDEIIEKKGTKVINARSNRGIKVDAVLMNDDIKDVPVDGSKIVELILTPQYGNDIYLPGGIVIGKSTFQDLLTSGYEYDITGNENNVLTITIKNKDKSLPKDYAIELYADARQGEKAKIYSMKYYLLKPQFTPLPTNPVEQTPEVTNTTINIESTVNDNTNGAANDSEGVQNMEQNTQSEISTTSIEE